MRRILVATAFIAILLVLSQSAGCQNDDRTGGLIGSGVGAAGSVGGYIVGNERDKAKPSKDNYFDSPAFLIYLV